MPASVGGAATTLARLAASVFSGVLAASVLVVSGTDAVESILKSLMVGGGTLAGSGRGIGRRWKSTWRSARPSRPANTRHSGSAWPACSVTWRPRRCKRRGSGRCSSSRRMENIGHCQIIMATHSPVLMAYPNATLLRLTKYGLEPVTVKETDHYKVMREFCEDPAGFARRGGGMRPPLRSLSSRRVRKRRR